MQYAEVIVLASLLPEERSATQYLKHSKAKTGLNNSFTLYTTTMKIDAYEVGDGKH